MKILTITHSHLGRPLKKPLILNVKEPQSLAEQKILRYILETFTTRGTGLAAFTCDNNSTLEVAKHYLFHRSASEKSL